MTNLTGILSDPTLLLTIALALLLVALLLLLSRSNKRNQELLAKVEQTEKNLLDRMEAKRDEEGGSAKKDREELNGNLRGLGDSLTRVLGETVRTQQAQLDSFATEIREIRETMGTRVAESVAQLNKEAQDNASRLQDVSEETKARLDAIDADLAAHLDETIGARFAEIEEEITSLKREMQDTQSLTQSVSELHRMLTGIRSRGSFGEVQLNALLSQILSPEQYAKDVAFIKGGEVCDFAVCLPGSGDGICYLPIDAHFPQETWLRLMDAVDDGDTAQIKRMEDELERRLLDESERIEEQFICPPRTTGFAVLFLPNEGMYAEMLRRPGLSETLQRDHHVTLAGPTTFAALLNSLQMGFATLAMQKRFEEAEKTLTSVKSEVSGFAEALNKTQKRIRQASESIEEATGRSKDLEKRLKDVTKTPLLSEMEEEDEDYGSVDWD